ncbi:MAG TPA: YibE/F family protein, partial [Acidimicrobiia bacterium]|nr:YibE/F family protein [Acidimicrobiia bacterium]
MGHSHAGGGNEKARVHTRARLLLAVLVGPLLLATVLGLVVLWPADASPPTPDFMGGAAKLADATVVKVDRRACGGGDQSAGNGSQPAGQQTAPCQEAKVKLTGRAAGAEAGKVVDIEIGEGADSPVLRGGDKIVVGRAGTGQAGEPDGGWYFSDFQRRGPLLALAVFFALAVIVFGRWRGLFALAGLVVSFGVLVRFMLPAILMGKNPVAVAVVGSAAIMFAALYLAHGINARTTTAVLGTVAAL